MPDFQKMACFPLQTFKSPRKIIFMLKILSILSKTFHLSLEVTMQMCSQDDFQAQQQKKIEVFLPDCRQLSDISPKFLSIFNEISESS